MSQNDPHILTFDISKKTNPATDRPFGERFAGQFTVRRPTLQDKRDIAVRDVAGCSGFGSINPKDLSTEAANINYIFAFFSVVAEETPDWFDPSALYDEDYVAVEAAWKEVSLWLKKFQSGRSG